MGLVNSITLWARPWYQHGRAHLLFMRPSGSAGTHNGMRNIIYLLGRDDFPRLRVGIGRPPGRMPVVDWVLSLPKKEAADDFAYAVDRGAQAALSLVTAGLEKTQQAFN